MSVNVVLQLWDSLPLRALVNMHLRFDGRLGFPGGLIDKVTQIIISSCHAVFLSSAGCHFTREWGMSFPDWFQISQTFLGKIRNFQ